MKPLWIALHLPLLQLEVFRPNWRITPDGTEVVLEQNRISCASCSALAAGAQHAMKKASVQMLLPDVMLYTRQPVLEQRCLEQVAIALLQYTPQVTHAAHDCLLMEVGASLRLFGGIHRLCHLIRHSMRVMGISISLSCAPTAMGAWLLARSTMMGTSHLQKTRTLKRVLKLKKLQQSLDQLPVALLPEAQPWLEWLHGIACTTLGSLQTLPRAGLKRRCGTQILDLMDQAYGHQAALFEWISVPLQFRSHTELPDRIEHAEMILAFIHSLLMQLMGWLAVKQLAVSQIDLYLDHERGRQAMAPTHLNLKLAEPVWREDHLLRLLKERLAITCLHAPAIAVSLVASQVQARQVANATLFPEPKAYAEDHHRLLELLVARLGDDQVLQAAPQEDHRPEVANTWVSVVHAQKKNTSKSQPLSTRIPNIPNQAARPVWLFEKALPLTIRHHRPYYHAPLKLLSGAERIEAGWWNGQLVTRDYFIAENPGHVRYWIYRERLGEQSDTGASWFVHGLFG
ncbi:Y-family DNA polymerase [Undibacterium sp. Rencai35W]|uniref:Y-family DNA polymerase n=1 Tax=Undibacterium sp. Rencai35W TaxID=3413046 RepID=UPI003BF2AE58